MRRVKQAAIGFLVFAIVFSMFGGTAFGASTRYAVVGEVTGTVKVTKAGGTKEIRVFTGMGLNEGDKLKVEKGSGVTLKVADREDEVVLGENWSGTLSTLRTNESGGSDTALKTWSGSMYNNVKKITGTSNTYKVETPTAVMGVRGTHFLLSINPATGLPTLFVSAGKVQAGNETQPQQQPGTMIMPAQQVAIYEDEDPDIGVTYFDPQSIVGQADKRVIAQLLMNKGLIDEENEEILGGLLNDDAEQGEGTLQFSNEEELNRYRTNVENALINILKNAVDNGTIDEDELQNIVDQANSQIPDRNKQYDLNREVPPIDRTAGVDPAAEQARQRQREQAEQKKQQQQQQKEQKREEIANNNSELINQIQQKRDEQIRQNEQLQQQKQQEAEDRMMEQLTESQREQLQQRLEEKKRQQQEQEQRRDPSSPIQPTERPSSGGSSSRSPASTTTELTLSKSEIIYGEPFTVSARVTRVSNGTPVPDGETVTFQRGTATLGSAKTANGVAELQVSGETSRQLALGANAISAFYPGTSSLQSNTSFARTLTVAPANTTVDLQANAASVHTGDNIAFAAKAKVAAPGSGQPAGTMTLYNGDTAVTEPKAADASGGAYFTVSMAEAGEYAFHAVFTPSDNRYRASEPSNKVTIAVSGEPDTEEPGTGEPGTEEPGTGEPGTGEPGTGEPGTGEPGTGEPKNPEAIVTKESGTEPNVFNIRVNMKNFTGDNAIYGLQLHLLHKPSAAADFGSETNYFNPNKFDESVTEDVLQPHFGVAGGEEMVESVYALTLFQTGEGVTFAEEDTAATLPFYAPTGTDTTIQLVYWQFVDKNGNPIGAKMTTHGVNVDGSEI